MSRQTNNFRLFIHWIFWPASFWIICVLVLFNCAYYGDRISNTYNFATSWAKKFIGVSHTFPEKVVSPQFFIDVWKLRDDIGVLERQFVSEEAVDSCYTEGDGEDEGGSPEVPATKEMIEQQKESQQKQAAAEAQCVADMRVKRESYVQAYDAFNQKWMSVLTKAIESGDSVAEVIMRQCSTTPVLDRSQIESTCDDLNSERRAIAAKRLREIGFFPAFDWEYELQSRKVRPPNEESEMKKFNLTIEQLREKVTKDIQELMLEQFKHGVLGYFGPWQLDVAVTNASNSDNIELYELLVHSSQIIPRAFTFSPSLDDKWATSSFSNLRLVREAKTPGVLTWGPALFSHYDNKPTITGGSPYRYVLTTSKNKRHILQSNESASYFEDALGDVISRSEAYIDQCLKQDSRWAVFLLYRVGYHEWVPEKMQSDTNKLSSKWQGSWELEKTFDDYREVVESTSSDSQHAPELIDAKWEVMRGAEITADGKHVNINFHTGSNDAPLKDGTCELRYSGGSTYIPQLLPADGHDDSRDQDWAHSIFGDLEQNCNDSGYASGAGSRSDFGQCSSRAKKNGAAFAPLDPGKRYKQVLVLCTEGEFSDAYTVRFLLLEGDRLVEFATLAPDNFRFYVRHYRRVASNSH